MFTTKSGNCGCYFCVNDKPHRHTIPVNWRSSGYLQVAESLDPKDILRTRVCHLCAHEEIDPGV